MHISWALVSIQMVLFIQAGRRPAAVPAHQLPRFVGSIAARRGDIVCDRCLKIERTDERHRPFAERRRVLVSIIRRDS